MKKTLTIISSMLFASTMFAQAGSSLNLPTDARTMGMGGVSAATDANAFNISVNPAAMALSDRTLAVGLDYMMWQPSYMKSNHIGFSGFYNIGGKFAVSLNAGYLMFPKMNLVDESGSFAGVYTPNDFNIGVGFAARLVDELALGVNLKYYGSSLMQPGFVEGYRNANAFAADISLMYRIKGFNITLAANNIGTKLNYGGTSYQLPMMAKLGFAYNTSFSDTHRITAAVEADYLVEGSGFAAGAGLEYSYSDMFFARGGYHFSANEKLMPSYASVGLGIRFFGVSLHGSYVLPLSGSALKNTFNIGLGFDF